MTETGLLVVYVHTRHRKALTLWRPLLSCGYSYVPHRVKPSFVIFDIRALMLTPESQSARMSKITNDGLTWSGTGCFIG